MSAQDPIGRRLKIDIEEQHVDAPVLRARKRGIVFVFIFVFAEGIPAIGARLAPRQAGLQTRLRPVARAGSFVVDEVNDGAAQESPVVVEFAGVAKRIEETIVWLA